LVLLRKLFRLEIGSVDVKRVPREVMVCRVLIPPPSLRTNKAEDRIYHKVYSYNIFVTHFWYNFFCAVYSSSGKKANDLKGLLSFGTMDEAINALSYEPTMGDAVPLLAHSKDNMCLFVAIGISLFKCVDLFFAWIGGRDRALCPSRFFIETTGDYRKQGWQDTTVHHYLRVLENLNLIGPGWIFKRLRSFQTFLGQYYFPLGNIFTHLERGTAYIIQSYSIPKSDIAKYHSVLWEMYAKLRREGCSDDRIMKLLEKYSYNTEDEGKNNF